MNDIERFFNLTTPNVGNDCLLWIGTATAHGRYGLFYYNGGPVYAHRFIYEQVVGPIPKGSHLHHNCNESLCVNTDHLTPLTVPEHAHQPGRHNGAKTHCTHGHEYNVENTCNTVDSRYGTPRRVCRVCERERMQRKRKGGK